MKLLKKKAKIKEQYPKRKGINNVPDRKGEVNTRRAASTLSLPSGAIRSSK
jgi:hypothetical protein